MVTSTISNCEKNRKKQVEKERNENMLPKSIFDLLVPKPSTTTPRPLIERLFEPLFEPLKSELNKLNKASSLDEEKLKKTTREPLRLFRDQVSPPELMLNSDSVRRSPHERVEEELTSPFPHTTVPLISLLEPLGQNARRREQVEVGRDRSVNVLGMPVGRRDGLLLSPLKGLSLGNQDMYGPISINDKYNVNWGFFDKLGTLFNSATQQVLASFWRLYNLNGYSKSPV
ncbi:unnamed protein product [Toxocara canis]|uniref:Uncharacterized protein n=1 Tax=Toxocara canis TaxID=6265 RepID=A0A183UFK8_TOXCA|nr:unnamed protein product [Toxocara canis]